MHLAVFLTGFYSYSGDSCLCYKLSLMQLDFGKNVPLRGKSFPSTDPSPFNEKQKLVAKPLPSSRKLQNPSWEWVVSPSAMAQVGCACFWAPRLRTLLSLLPLGLTAQHSRLVVLGQEMQDFAFWAPNFFLASRPLRMSGSLCNRPAPGNSKQPASVGGYPPLTPKNKKSRVWLFGIRQTNFCSPGFLYLASAWFGSCCLRNHRNSLYVTYTSWKHCLPGLGAPQPLTLFCVFRTAFYSFWLPRRTGLNKYVF